MRIIRNIVCALVFFTPPAIAVEVQDLAAVREAVRLFVEAEVTGVTGEVEITVGQLDHRLRLARCESPLETSLPYNVKPLGNITVNVRCAGAKPWSLMVQAQIQQFIDVVVASRPLGRNLTLGEGDIALAKTDISRLGGGYYATTQEVSGMVLKRSVTAGTVLTTTMLAPAILIKRGEKVIISAETDSLQVRMEGVALEEGARGDLIEVKNLSSQQVIEAEVLAPGVVRVRM
ncbi:MAG: flagellar basal body P-ring formation chaperone FlgA [Gammaproteobacteria bacterium]|nr:flagellar basal body P-ring formation chaperone FlgA [Gammaproteobacteria bacterium]